MNHERQRQERQVRDIYIKSDSEWTQIDTESGSEEFKQYAVAYTQYKNRPAYYSEDAHHTDSGITVFRYNNEHYKPTYVFDGNGQNIPILIPIIDMADVKVFLTDVPNANWFKARDYQAWAYRDFVFDETEPRVKYYASRHSSHLFFQTSNYRDVVTIDIDGLPPNIIFKLSRNENGSVYYEKNDGRASRVRICDNDNARSGYLGFYRRITDFGDFIITPASAVAAPAHDAYGPEYQDFASYLHQANTTAAAVVSAYQNHDIKLPLAPVCRAFKQIMKKNNALCVLEINRQSACIRVVTR